MRPTKLTDEVQRIICTDVSLGIPLTMAVAAAGISDATFYRWMHFKKRRFREFREAVAKARRDRAAMLLATIVSASRAKYDQNAQLIREGDPEYALRLLERVEPNDFGVRVKMQVQEEMIEGIGRLKYEFRNEREILRRALWALAGEVSAPERPDPRPRPALQ